MAECPICGLGERCRNHWVAVQEPNGEVEFQIGAMTASEDNLILLRNKLKNPPLRALFDKIQLAPVWSEEQGRVLAYLHWPLELRGAVHRTLFPAGAPGNDRPLPPTPIFRHHLDDLQLQGVELDAVNCLDDELIYKAHFQINLSAAQGESASDGLTVPFAYVQLLWANGVDWQAKLESPSKRQQAEAMLRLVFAGMLDPLRALFCGHEVLVLSEDQPAGLVAGVPVDEIALPAPEAGGEERHLGEEIEAWINQRRLQPLLRDHLLLLLDAPLPVQVQ